MKPSHRSAASPDDVSEALDALRQWFLRAFGYSILVNLLALAPTFYMLQTYERVVNSRSLATLAMLTVLVVFFIGLMEVLDWVRSKLMHAASEALDARLSRRVFDATFQAQLRNQPVGAQPLADLRQIRQFLASPTPLAIADTPIALLYILIVFAMSPTLGVFGLMALLVMVVIGVFTESKTSPPLLEAQRAGAESQRYANASLKNAEVVHALGMWTRIRDLWLERQKRLLSQQANASDAAGSGSALSKFVMMSASSLTLGLGAWLTLEGHLDPMGSAMFLCWILAGKALQAPQQLISQWRQVVTFRDNLQRLRVFLSQLPATEASMPLPPPRGALSVEALVAAAPGGQLPILRGVAFALQPGESLAVVGPSAAGKSTLARLLVGLWPAVSGRVRLDGVDIYAWNKEELGPHIGYLPQDIELFDGTLAENIARFGELDEHKIRAAAAAAGLDDLIDALPDGLDTLIGGSSEAVVLSGGQRQRVGLARALYGDPKFVVLDEPNSSLDEAGERMLVQALLTLRARGTTQVVMTHRTSVLAAMDKILVLREGQAAAFGPRDEVLAALQGKATMPATGARAPTAAGNIAALPQGGAA